MNEENTTIVIFGGTGDLAQRKLVPALFQLRSKMRLPETTRIVGFSRRPNSDDQYRDLMRNGVREFSDLDVRKDEWASFAKNLYYVSGDLNIQEDLLRLKQRLEELDRGRKPANRLFFLSISPAFYEAAVKNLDSSGLSSEEEGWRRVVIEKPFGFDLASAQELNTVVAEVFREDQVFRIDHYLGKETVQNLLVFRFANAIFEPVWNRNYIDNVQITVAEQVDVGDRGGYYDQSGVIRDMVQNHLLQLMALVAMEPPSVADAESLRNKKVEVLRAIRRWSPEDAVKHAIAGQYKGYLDTNGVPADSKTPTYAALRLYVDNWRWSGVPFYLRTGKAMAVKSSEIMIQFQRPPHIVFTLGECQDLTPNVLGMTLQPDEGVHLKFEVKVPDQGMCMESVNMEFHYGSTFKDQAIPEAYERLLEDALAGDASLFIRNDHIEEAWKIVDPLLHAWEDHDTAVHSYDVGSWGPEASDDFLAHDGRAWQRVSGWHKDSDS